MIRITTKKASSGTTAAETALVQKKIRAIKAAMTRRKMDRVVGKVSEQIFRSIVEATPKKWFGQVRRSWQLQKPAEGSRIIVNGNKIMRWLEEGTQAHGPVRAKALFIPLTSKAMLAHTAAEGIEPKNVELKGDANWVGEIVRGLRVFTGKRGKSTTLIYGVDYVLAKRVKGITALRIVAAHRIKAKVLLETAFTDYLRAAIKDAVKD